MYLHFVNWCDITSKSCHCEWARKKFDISLRFILVSSFLSLVSTA